MFLPLKFLSTETTPLFSRQHVTPICVGLLTAALFAVCSATAAVYRCKDPDQPVLYSQFQCPPDHQQATINPDPQNLIDTPPLTAAEQTALARLQQDLARDRTRARAARMENRRQRLKRLAQRKALCTDARSQLEALAARKRRGYGADESRKLAQRGRELRQQRNANC
jgi:hypothetical protein